MATATRLTVDEYLDRYADDPRRMELIDGEVVEVGGPKPDHGRVHGRIAGALYAYERERGGVELYDNTGVQLGEYDFYVPDVALTRPQPRVDARGWWVDVPLLCVEVRSPSTWHHDIGRKRQTYEARGVAELWLVDTPAQTVIVYRCSAPAGAAFDISVEIGRGELLTSPYLPGFAMPLDELFA